MEKGLGFSRNRASRGYKTISREIIRGIRTRKTRMTISSRRGGARKKMNQSSYRHIGQDGQCQDGRDTLGRDAKHLVALGTYDLGLGQGTRWGARFQSLPKHLARQLFEAFRAGGCHRSSTSLSFGRRQALSRTAPSGWHRRRAPPWPCWGACSRPRSARCGCWDRP